MLSREETKTAFDCCTQVPQKCECCPLDGPGFGKECKKQVRENVLRCLDTLREITDESAIYHLNRSGWMQKHDRAMSFDSLTAVVNNLLRDGNKTISVNIYPWKDDGNETA